MSSFSKTSITTSQNEDFDPCHLISKTRSECIKFFQCLIVIQNVYPNLALLFHALKRQVEKLLFHFILHKAIMENTFFISISLHVCYFCFTFWLKFSVPSIYCSSTYVTKLLLTFVLNDILYSYIFEK